MFACLVTIATKAAADLPRQSPVGLVLVPGNGSIIPAHSQTPLSAKAGEILFEGDILRSGASAATFLFCPAKSSETLAPAGEVSFQNEKLSIRKGNISEKRTIPSCFLPSVVHLANASEQHYGTALVRGLDKPVDLPVIPRENLAPSVLAEIAPLDAVLKTNASDPAALIERAAIFEKNNLPANALADYQHASAGWADAVWIKGKIFELQEVVAKAAQAASTAALSQGNTFAVLVGISKYQKLPQDLWLNYADADAISFERYLKSPRGGSVPAGNIVLLTNENATTAAIRNAFQTFLKGRAGKNDSVMIVLAAHGTVETAGNKGAYVVAYDTDPQDLAATGFPMVEIQDLVNQQLSNIGRVALFVDVCHAGTIGAIHSTSVNDTVQHLGEAQGDIFGFMASGPKELSREGSQFGGGHGVFSYFLLKSFGPEADEDQDGTVSTQEVIDFVRSQVAQATDRKQHPRDFGTQAGDVPVADLKKDAVPISRWPKLLDTKGVPVYLASASPGMPLPADNSQALETFSNAIRNRRLLPDRPGSAFDALQALQGRLSPEEYVDRQNMLRVALENEGQQVLLRYLEGDQTPQLKRDFLLGADYFAAALRLTPESLYLDARLSFCKGRALLFDKKFGEAAGLLERSARIDPAGAYAYNALGIAYLEQADFGRALPALRDALRKAPYWTYPYHNLALASIEAGDYEGAVRAYQQALRLTPQFSYLHYNLGLAYERLNRRKDAETEFRKAIALAPGLADAYNALGSLRAEARRPGPAEDFYKQALQKDPGLLAARQNLALLLSTEPKRSDEALGLWRDNLARAPDYLPSRLSLAEALKEQKKTAQAIAEYQEVIRLKPEYVAARVALAELLLTAKSLDTALEQARQASALEPRNPDILELTGDIQKKLGQPGEARKSYEAAIKASYDRAALKRVHNKLEGSQ